MRTVNSKHKIYEVRLCDSSAKFLKEKGLIDWEKSTRVYVKLAQLMILSYEANNEGHLGLMSAVRDATDKGSLTRITQHVTEWGEKPYYVAQFGSGVSCHYTLDSAEDWINSNWSRLRPRLNDRQSDSYFK